MDEKASKIALKMAQKAQSSAEDALERIDSLESRIASLKAQPKPVEAGPKWRGDYSSGQSYAKGDIVRGKAGTYIATSSTSSPPPGAGWTTLARDGRNGADGNRGVVQARIEQSPYFSRIVSEIGRAHV